MGDSVKLGKKILLYFIVAIVVVTLCFLFLKVFAFDKEKEEKGPIPEITEELIDELYSYLPKTTHNNVATLYTSYYTTISNLSYSVVGNMVNQYIMLNDEFKLEKLTEEELKSANINGKPLYKISEEVFMDCLEQVFGKIKYSPTSFDINNKTTATFKEKYFYVYSKDSEFEDTNVYFKKRHSYTIANDGNTIKINEYFLKCDTKTLECFNTEGPNSQINSYIKYDSNIKIEDYKDRLKEYEHVFEYADGHFHWVSTQGI